MQGAYSSLGPSSDCNALAALGTCPRYTFAAWRREGLAERVEIAKSICIDDVEFKKVQWPCKNEIYGKPRFRGPKFYEIRIYNCSGVISVITRLIHRCNLP